MAGPDPLRRFRDEAVAAFAPSLDPNAPGLVTVLRRSVDYADIQRAVSQVVVDRRALLLALVAIGLETSDHYANSATWFATWLKDKLPHIELHSSQTLAPTSREALEEAASHEFRLVTSESVRSAVLQAVEFAKATVGRERIALRHLFLALLVQPNHKFEIKEFNWSATDSDVAELRALLLERIGSDPESGENMEAWRTLLGEGTTGSSPSFAPTPSHATEPGSPPPPPPPARPAEFVSGFDADRTSDDSDPLQTNADVVAMARLVCHEGADPPISIGVFGGWGSGKSTFMEALQRHVTRLSDPGLAADQPPDGPHFVFPIVQIRFNAWQFADANLWASLTAEFFDQLRAGGFEGGGKRAHARLIEDVNEHVRGLSREATLRRTALAKADEELRAAQIAHDQAVEEQHRGVRQAMISGLAEAYDRNRSGLVRYGLLDPKSEEQLVDFLRIAKDLRTETGRLKRILALLGKQWRFLAGIGVLALVLAMAVFAATDWEPAAALTGLATAAAGLAPILRRGLALLREVVRQTAPFADRIDEAEKAGLHGVLAREVELRSAAEEADALREASDRADRALARYVDPAARSNPPRVLRYLLEDDPDTRAFEQEIGLIGRARRLFEALDQIVGHNRDMKERLRALPANPPDETVWEERCGLERTIDTEMPDRIILYIDDLDRCTHDQVYKVLQAVHLLLAFKLFVVVVAVDMEWVEAAVARSIEFAGQESETVEVKEKARRERAIEYLSKIFQLPFWLKPFAGEEDSRYGEYVRSLTRAPRPAPPPPPPPEPERPPADTGDLEVEAVGSDPVPPPPPPSSDQAEEDEPLAAVEATPATPSEDVARALRTLQLDPVEEEFLAGPEIAALAATDPRGVKRLVNVYKIARARLSEADDAMILGDDVRPPAYPLIAICAAIETGQPLAVADNFYDGVKRIAANPDAADFRTTDEIESAIAAAITERNGRPASARDFLPIARIVRRYSFNRYH